MSVSEEEDMDVIIEEEFLNGSGSDWEEGERDEAEAEPEEDEEEDDPNEEEEETDEDENWEDGERDEAEAEPEEEEEEEEEEDEEEDMEVEVIDLTKDDDEEVVKVMVVEAEVANVMVVEAEEEVVNVMVVEAEEEEEAVNVMIVDAEEEYEENEEMETLLAAANDRVQEIDLINDQKPYDFLLVALQHPELLRHEVGIYMVAAFGRETTAQYTRLLFKNCPDVLKTLLGLTGVYSDCNVRALYDSPMLENELWLNMNQFWRDVSEDFDAQILLCESYCTPAEIGGFPRNMGPNDYCSKKQWCLFCVRCTCYEYKLQAYTPPWDFRAESRAVEMADILINLSKHPENAAMMAGNLPFLRYMVFLYSCSHLDMDAKALNLLSNVAQFLKLQFPLTNYHISKRVIAMVYSGLFTQCRDRILNSVRSLGALAADPKNIIGIVELLQRAVCSRLVLLFVPRDEKLTESVMVCLRSLAKLGRETCKRLLTVNGITAVLIHVMNCRNEPVTRLHNVLITKISLEVEVTPEELMELLNPGSSESLDQPPVEIPCYGVDSDLDVSVTEDPQQTPKRTRLFFGTEYTRARLFGHLDRPTPTNHRDTFGSSRSPPSTLPGPPSKRPRARSMSSPSPSKSLPSSANDPARFHIGKDHLAFVRTSPPTGPMASHRRIGNGHLVFTKNPNDEDADAPTTLMVRVNDCILRPAGLNDLLDMTISSEAGAEVEK